MKTVQTDVAIIGAGTAGLSARREIELRNKSSVLIEGGPHGTTCARVGCMPSKLLIAAANAAEGLRTAPKFGVHPKDTRIDGPAVLERVRAERDRFVGFVLKSVADYPEESKLTGYARFVEATVLEVDDHTRVEAQSVIIATGSSPWVPPNLEPVRDRTMVNDDIFELEDIPESIAVFGTGVIGLEIGQALHRLGSNVQFFNPFDDLAHAKDPVVKESIREVLSQELALHCGVDAAVEPHGEHGVTVRWKGADGEHEAQFDRVLSAAGRRPNLGRLGLAEAGFPMNERGIPVHDETTKQIGDLPVFIAGDVCGHRPLLHEAADEGKIAGANAATFPQVEAHTRRVPLSIAFTSPGIALVGKSYADLDLEQTAIGQLSFRSQGRARVIGEDRGVLRVYVDKNDHTIVGAELFGPAAEHTAHLLAWAVQQEMKVQRALRMPFYHPVVEEGLRTALRRAANQLDLVPEPCAFELDCGVGS